MDDACWADACWLKEAWREFGQAERAGDRHNPRIVAFFRDVGHPGIVRDEVAWCAAFCGACLERAGFASTRSLLARSYLKWGRSLTEPRVGCIAVFSRGSDPGSGHVGFWLGETDDAVVVLGGNQANSVSVARYPKSRLIGLRWPDARSSANGDAVFERALAHVLEMEGGYTDDPHDPGGPTHRGITLAVLAAWRNVAVTDANRQGLVEDLKAIDAATVRAIYRRRYWERAQCGELAPALALMHFDTAVNQGFGTAIRFLQEAVGAGVDGEIGPETRAAIARADVVQILEAYAEIRRRRYRALPHFWRFGRGWLARVTKTLARAKTLAAETAASQSQPVGVEDMTTIETGLASGKWWGHSLTVWGTIVTILSTVVPALAPVTGVDVTGDLVRDAGEQAVDAMQAVGALIGTLMTIYGRMRATAPLQRSLLKAKG
ncbi:TIGR02594 family protein [Hyphomicrobium sp.]|uniref:TIGR02594 family protein n=1 Tax=Hyphomicrobium sp. TaxID=82 RepID=UPI002FDD584A